MLMKILVIVMLAMAVIGGYLMVAHTEEPKEPIWGNSTDGIAISVNFTKPKYVLGKEIDFTVDIKNVSNATMNMILSNPYAQYRMALFDQDGRPVAKSKLVIEEENRPPSRTGPAYWRYIANPVAPGQNSRETFYLSNWFKIENAGIYQLAVMRQVDTSWDKGFAVSNLAKVEIIKPE